MNDLISRQAVLDETFEVDTKEYGRIDVVGVDVIDALPSINPQEPKWIPVSERFPEEPGTYMTTIDYGKYGLEVGQKYYYGQGLGWSYDCVIAWMSLPEPYKAESEDE